MSDGQKLKDCIAEYRKANKTLDDNLKRAEQRIEQTRQEQTEKQLRQS